MIRSISTSNARGWKMKVRRTVGILSLPTCVRCQPCPLSPDHPSRTIVDCPSLTISWNLTGGALDASTGPEVSIGDGEEDGERRTLSDMGVGMIVGERGARNARSGDREVLAVGRHLF